MSHKEAFELCRKAMLTVHAAGAENSNQEDVDAILVGCKILRGYIAQLMLPEPSKTLMDHLRHALQEVHPDMPYEHPLSFVRDIADVLVTLERLTETLHRSDYSKILEAKIVCSSLAAHNTQLIEV